MNWYTRLFLLFGCGVFATCLTPAYGWTSRAKDTCDCSATCAPRIEIRTSGGVMAEDCPDCPEPTEPTCPSPTCPLCPTCAPPIPTTTTTTTTAATATTTTEESPSTTTPDPGPCPPGYELAGPMTYKCYMIVEEFMTGANSIDSLCGDGGSILILRDQTELNLVTSWAWAKLGSDHISFWTSGSFVYNAPSGSVVAPVPTSLGYLWGDATPVVLSDFTWSSGSEPTSQMNACIRVSEKTDTLDLGPCATEAHFPICQYPLTVTT